MSGQLEKFSCGQFKDKDIVAFLRCDNGIMVKREKALILRRCMLKFLQMNCHDLHNLLSDGSGNYLYIYIKYGKMSAIG